jgi:hypothetical protein
MLAPYLLPNVERRAYIPRERPPLVRVPLCRVRIIMMDMHSQPSCSSLLGPALPLAIVNQVAKEPSVSASLLGHGYTVYDHSWRHQTAAAMSACQLLQHGGHEAVDRARRSRIRNNQRMRFGCPWLTVGEAASTTQRLQRGATRRVDVGHGVGLGVTRGTVSWVAGRARPNLRQGPFYRVGCVRRSWLCLWYLHWKPRQPNLGSHSSTRILGRLCVTTTAFGTHGSFHGREGLVSSKYL